MPTPWVDFSDPATLGRVLAGVTELGASTVFVDHFTQTTGNIDENLSDIKRIMGAFRALAEGANVAVNVIHHQTKNSARFGVSSSDSLRGHGSIPAMCELTALVERQVSDPLALTVRPIAVRGPAFDNFGAKFSFTPKTDGSLELDQARFWGVGVENIDAEIEMVVVDILENEPNLTQTALRAAVAQRVQSAGDPAIRSMLARLESDGRVVVKRGKQNAKLYELPGGSGG